MSEKSCRISTFSTTVGGEFIKYIYSEQFSQMYPTICFILHSSFNVFSTPSPLFFLEIQKIQLKNIQNDATNKNQKN